MTISTHQLDVPSAVLTYDVHTPAVVSSDRRPLFVVGSPMGASGFEQLVAQINDRVVLTYDPRVSDRSQLLDPAAVSVEIHGDDLHRVAVAAGLGPVDVFASSGGASAALAWITAEPDDLGTVVAHEPPLALLLPDAEVIVAAIDDITQTYADRGFGAAMAKFIALVMHQGELGQEYLQHDDPDPTQFGLPTDDDGRRDDALLGRNLPMPQYRPQATALRGPVRLVPAVGAASAGTMAYRSGLALADLLGVTAVEFPGDHGGFAANPWSPGNDPAAFAAKLLSVLDLPPGS